MIFLFVSGCKSSDEKLVDYFNYGTTSDSARYYYLEGWKKIMDEGRWTESEKAFRKAVELDDQFVLGKLLVGRISKNLDEREHILIEVNEIEPGDEAVRLLYEIYRNSVSFMNMRERGEQITSEVRTEKDSVSEFNYRRFITLHPGSIYETAEYIEILHHKYGSKAALDTMENILTLIRDHVPFFVSYHATLHAELGNYGKAGQLINRLDSLLDENAPARYFTRASVYQAMDSLAYAKAMAEKAYQLDTNHILAKSMVDLISD